MIKSRASNIKSLSVGAGVGVGVGVDVCSFSSFSYLCSCVGAGVYSPMYVPASIGLWDLCAESNIPIRLSKPASLGRFTVSSGADLVDRVEEADDRYPSGDGADRIVSGDWEWEIEEREPYEPGVDTDLSESDPMDVSDRKDESKETEDVFSEPSYPE